jgi:hypothetical protein
MEKIGAAGRRKKKRRKNLPQVRAHLPFPRADGIGSESEAAVTAQRRPVSGRYRIGTAQWQRPHGLKKILIT